MAVHKKIFIFFLFFKISFSLFSQSELVFNEEKNQDNKNLYGTVQQAMADVDYMVTPGDIYSLTYLANGTAVSYSIAVDSTYKIRVSNLAVLDAADKSYIALKRQVESIVQKNYPLSGVQFVLVNPASYKVVVKGEVKETVERSVWALSRLSSVISGTTTEYSSFRDVTVTSANGKKKTYDLFKASRDGDLSQNPYVRPNDVITVNRILRVVNISGAVERPGAYELMKGENLKELVEYYGNGLTELADTSRITLVRNRETKNKSGEQIYLDSDAISENFVLNNGDSIRIGNVSELMPSIIVEGVINNPKSSSENSSKLDESENSVGSDASYRTSVKFYSGENYATFIRRISGMFSVYSDLRNAYIERNGDKLSINLEEILYNAAFVSSYAVELDDKLVIPFQQNFQKIVIKGEVIQSKEIDAWPLRRLSEILSDNLTEFSSSRDVSVVGVDGKIKIYDLFKASRFGELDQNPYIRSGETIIVQRMERKVTISGAVERPGTYELIKGENLKELIEYYGNGLKVMADVREFELVRSVNDEEGFETGKKMYLNSSDINSNYELECYDTVSISTYKDLRPVVFLEGAVSTSTSTSTSTRLESSDRKILQFENGTNYSDLVRANASLFASEVADSKNAYVLRDGEKIPLNIDEILYNSDFESTLNVVPRDTLIVPFRQYFVTVAGSVNSPGRFPYIPDRTADYYVGLAGGFDIEKNTGEAMRIVDINGKKLSANSFITPESTITAKTNSFTYFFQRYSGVVTVIASLISTTISIIAITNAN